MLRMRTLFVLYKFSYFRQSYGKKTNFWTFSGCVAFDIIGLINMTILLRPLKGYLLNCIFLLPMSLSIHRVHYIALIDIVFQ